MWNRDHILALIARQRCDQLLELVAALSEGLPEGGPAVSKSSGLSVVEVVASLLWAALVFWQIKALRSCALPARVEI